MHPDLPPSAQRPRILLADDDVQFREGFSRLLLTEGYDCTCAVDGPQALQLLRTSEFDALISDIFMPGNLDLELVAEIPQLASGLPVILLTGRPTLETAVRSVNLAVTGYLVKPPDLAELHRLLDKAIVGYRACRRIAQRRQRFEQYARDLARIEQTLRDPASGSRALPVAEYLKMVTGGFISMLDEIEQSLGLLARLKESGEAFREQELIEALKRATEEIEETRRSFKSKRLGKLRADLEAILERQR